MTRQSTAEVYYLQAISPKADRKLVIRCYGRQHDVIVDVLMEEGFSIEKISELKFNTTEKLVNLNQAIDTTAHNIPSFTSPETIEQILKKKK